MRHHTGSSYVQLLKMNHRESELYLPNYSISNATLAHSLKIPICLSLSFTQTSVYHNSEIIPIFQDNSGALSRIIIVYLDDRAPTITPRKNNNKRQFMIIVVNSTLGCTTEMVKFKLSRLENTSSGNRNVQPKTHSTRNRNPMPRNPMHARE